MRIVFFLLIISFANFKIYSQTINLKEKIYWLDFGIGGANKAQIAGNLSLNYRK